MGKRSLPKVNDDGFFEMRFESTGELGANLAGQIRCNLDSQFSIRNGGFFSGTLDQVWITGSMLSFPVIRNRRERFRQLTRSTVIVGRINPIRTDVIIRAPSSS